MCHGHNKDHNTDDCEVPKECVKKQKQETPNECELSKAEVHAITKGAIECLKKKTKKCQQEASVD